jgi:hypothetical protein
MPPHPWPLSRGDSPGRGVSEVRGRGEGSLGHETDTQKKDG